jgi:cytochrome c oxidase subunit II
MMRARLVALMALVPACSACSSRQSALDSGGVSAAQIQSLFWTFTTTAIAVWLLVMIGLILALSGRQGVAEATAQPLIPDPRIERRATITVNGLTTATALILIALTLASFLTSHSLASLEKDEALELKLTGHQWWWDIRYADKDPHRIVTTANEIHLPLGRTVRLELASSDVIHSFWVPNIAGKMDLVPGRNNVLFIKPERVGSYRGQCAEFCGLQHAHMALLVVVEPEPQFAAWYAAELKSAPEPGTPEAKRGKQLFSTDACIMCHQIRGSNAGGRLGPDLTHVARRSTIAAGTLPMSEAGLDTWIADPQAVKPGAAMPKVALTAVDRHSIIAYLKGLQ